MPRGEISLKRRVGLSQPRRVRRGGEGHEVVVAHPLIVEIQPFDRAEQRSADELADSSRRIADLEDRDRCGGEQLAAVREERRGVDGDLVGSPTAKLDVGRAQLPCASGPAPTPRSLSPRGEPRRLSGTDPSIGQNSPQCARIAHGSIRLSGLHTSPSARFHRRLAPPFLPQRPLVRARARRLRAGGRGRERAPRRALQRAGLRAGLRRRRRRRRPSVEEPARRAALHRGLSVPRETA